MEKTVSYGETKYSVRRDGDKLTMRYHGGVVGHVVPTLAYDEESGIPHYVWNGSTVWDDMGDCPVVFEDVESAVDEVVTRHREYSDLVAGLDKFFAAG